MNKFILTFIFLAIANIDSLSAEASSPVETTECSKELLLAYYPNEFVKITLEKYQVPKEQWETISKELIIKDKLIMKTVEEKASRMTPNPLKDVQQRQIAVKLYRDTLLEEFSEVLKSHGVTDEDKIEEMLADIQKQKAKRFAKCIQKQRESVEFQQKPLPSTLKPAK